MIQVGYPVASARTSTSEMAVQTVAICAGSGGDMLLGHEADVYFTGEMSHHEVLAAVAAGGHSNTERGYLPVLASRLRDELRLLKGQGTDSDAGAHLEVHVSTADHDPLQFV
ncbi:hypothetical protein HWV62_33881 [Athelia sp. TMB]|nr:hypothetical protein HWV62_39996 [Athelia sp. TMB]KAF7981389.1 hypothetical protein HWV62_33881 [Athelia sp. TMB]